MGIPFGAFEEDSEQGASTEYGMEGQPLKEAM